VGLRAAVLVFVVNAGFGKGERGKKLRPALEGGNLGIGWEIFIVVELRSQSRGVEGGESGGGGELRMSAAK
jgi:hypothetical protein